VGVANGLASVTLRISSYVSFSRLFAVEILKSLDHKNIINAYVNRAGIEGFYRFFDGWIP
jgi:hypothetical protein